MAKCLASGRDCARRTAHVAAALFRLENSREPADIKRVLGSLVGWLAAPAQASLRRAFVVWLKQELLPARVPGRLCRRSVISWRWMPCYRAD
jgi:hypothetical protein